MDAKKLTVGLNALKFSIAIVGVVLSLFLFNAPNVVAGTEAVETYRDGSVIFSSAIWFTIIIFFALCAFVLLFFFVQLISNPKRTVISILGILIFLGIYLVISLMGTTDTNETLALRNQVSPGVINTTSAGIYTIIIGMFAGLLVVILGPFMGRYRK
jgi:tetrahydromethanopterin S-methyltransferase subunit F